MNYELWDDDDDFLPFSVYYRYDLPQHTNAATVSTNSGFTVIVAISSGLGYRPYVLMLVLDEFYCS